MILVGRSARDHLVSAGSFISAADEIRQKAETSTRIGLLAFQAGSDLFTDFTLLLAIRQGFHQLLLTPDARLKGV